MITTDQVQNLLADNNASVVGSDGDKIGKIGQVFLDDESGNPEWVTVKTGLFGGAESFVPLSQGNISGSEIRVPFDNDKVKRAPQIQDSDGHLEPDQEAELYRYYGMDSADDTGDRQDADAEGTVGRDTSGPTTDNAMTRSEEQLKVGTVQREAGRARLRKFVVTENVTTTVPVSRGGPRQPRADHRGQPRRRDGGRGRHLRGARGRPARGGGRRRQGGRPGRAGPDGHRDGHRAA